MQYNTGDSIIICRYIDDIFMTWNRSERELKELLKAANNWHPNIKLDYKIGQSLSFLDVLLTNDNGLLSTSVYHKPAAEPYVVPFISDHHRSVCGNIVQTSLARAIRYSSTFEAFLEERRDIKLMLLYNGCVFLLKMKDRRALVYGSSSSYPSAYIENQYGKFFLEYHDASSFVPVLDDKRQFALMRRRLLSQPTLRQSQIAKSAASADLNNDQVENEGGVEPVVTKNPNETNPTGRKDRLFIHYTHEKRFQSFKRDMHRVYKNVFTHTPAMGVKLVVGNRNRRDARHELIRKRPSRSLLQSTAIKRKYSKFLGN
jgi:hypothetical protein